jgi:hypothetical protein
MAHEPREDRSGDEAERSEDLAQVEAALTGLAPRPARLSAARLMYLAGQESVASARPRRAAWLWPALATASTLAAAVCASLLVMQPTPQVVERIVYVERPANDRGETKLVESTGQAATDNKVSPSNTAQIPTPHYLRARDLAMSQGVDSLPAFQPGAAGVEIRPATYREMQNRAIEGEYGGRRKLPDAGFYSWPNLLLRGDL